MFFYDDTQITVFRDKNWINLNPLNIKNLAVNTFPSKPFQNRSIEKLDVTNVVMGWSVEWKLGNPYGVININTGSDKELVRLMPGDMWFIESSCRGKKQLYGCGIQSSNSVKTSHNKNININLSFSCKEPGKFFEHEIYYNPNLAAIGSISPYLAFTGGAMNLQGTPANVIKSIIYQKMCGYYPDGSKSEFNPGFLLNDGRRMEEWLDLSSVIDLNDPGINNPTINLLIKEDPVKLSYWPVEGSSLDGQIWRLLNTYSGSPLWELFTYCDYVNGKPMQKLIYRPLPFYCDQYQWYLWDNLTTYEFEDSDLSGDESFTQSEDDLFNFYFINAQQNNAVADQVMNQSRMQKINYGGHELHIPITMGPLIERFGFKKYVPSLNADLWDPTSYLTRGHQVTDKMLAEAICRAWDYNFMNMFFHRGQITVNIKPWQPLPKPGMKAKNLTTGFEYYIVSVSLSGGPREMTKATLGLTRGMTRDTYKSFIDPSVRKELIKEWKGAGL